METWKEKTLITVNMQETLTTYYTFWYLFSSVRKDLSIFCIKLQSLCDALMCCIWSSRQFIT